MLYDIVIIGAGPAGLTAGIYATRAMLKTLLLEKIAPGGLVITTEKVENYPGFSEGISGYELMEQTVKQATRFGLEIIQDEMLSIKELNSTFRVKTASREYEALSVIITTGTSHRKLGVPGEDIFLGRGISYCATCDGPLFKDKEVVVLGGGDVATEEALFLTKFARKIYLVHRRDKLRATGILQKQLRNNPKIEVIWNSTVSKIEGKNRIENVVIRNLVDNKETNYKVDGVFVLVGFEPNTVLFREFVELDKEGYIITDSNMRTSRDGVFAAGDVRSGTLRQVITACGDGARAAVSAQHYIEKLKA
jgi:thioredoxin reductase (NADPH)